MIREKVLELEKSKEQWNITHYNIIKLKNKCGVWVMYDERDQLLEVAKTSDIFEELDYDLSWIMKQYPKNANRDKSYTARTLFEFNKKFDILKCDRNRTTAKYRNIAEESERIVVYVILEDEAVSSDRIVREKLELEIAVNEQALYWNAYGKQRRKAREYFTLRK